MSMSIKLLAFLLLYVPTALCTLDNFVVCLVNRPMPQVLTPQHPISRRMNAVVESINGYSKCRIWEQFLFICGPQHTIKLIANLILIILDNPLIFGTVVGNPIYCCLRLLCDTGIKKIGCNSLARIFRDLKMSPLEQVHKLLDGDFDDIESVPRAPIVLPPPSISLPLQPVRPPQPPVGMRPPPVSLSGHPSVPIIIQGNTIG